MAAVETIPQLIARAAAAYGDRPALRARRGGQWVTWTWRQHRALVLRAARALVGLGVRPGDSVAIMGRSCPQWFWADLGAIHAGALPAGIYTNTLADQVRYIATHCEAAVVFVGDEALRSLFERLRPSLPHLRAIVVMEGGKRSDGAYTWEDFLALAEGVPESAVAERVEAARPDRLCTLVYTSGATGVPKAVMVSHGNVCFLAGVAARQLDLRPEDRFLCYLPLSHIAEQCVSLFLPAVAGGCTHFADSLETLPEDLREVRPTVFFGVPRVWEKIQARVQAAGAAAPALRRRLLAWARRKGLAGGYAVQRGRRPPLACALARRLVFDRVRERLGLDCARLCLTSAAPISRDTLEFFLSLGIPVLEVYGMSEVAGPATISLPTCYRTGSAGRALPGTELRLAQDGEILLRGPHVCLGYYKDDAATAESLDTARWLHTGDVGRLDPDGFLFVTDRKKELLITSGGENVAPARIEALLRSIPGVGQAVVVGERRNYCAALLSLDPERLPAAARAAGSPARTTAEARACSRFRGWLQAEVDRVNEKLARYESVRRFELLPGEMTVGGGELTPTLKLRRRLIHEKYRAEIEALYA